jgi:hypothetical protein
MLGECPQWDYDFKCFIEAKVKCGTTALQHSRVTIGCSICNIENHATKNYPKYDNV